MSGKESTVMDITMVVRSGFGFFKICMKALIKHTIKCKDRNSNNTTTTKKVNANPKQTRAVM